MSTFCTRFFNSGSLPSFGGLIDHVVAQQCTSYKYAKEKRTKIKMFLINRVWCLQGYEMSAYAL